MFHIRIAKRLDNKICAMNPISASDFCINSKNSWDEIRGKMDCEVILTFCQGIGKAKDLVRKKKKLHSMLPGILLE